MRMISVNTSRLFGGNSVSRKLSDILEPKAGENEEGKTSDDIILDLKKKINGDSYGKEEKNEFI